MFRLGAQVLGQAGRRAGASPGIGSHRPAARQPV